MKIRERIGKNQRKRLGVLVAVILLSLAGCGNSGPEHVAETEVDKEEPKITDELMNLAEGYREIYEETAAEGTLADLEVMREITEYFGRTGYAAVDINNQINMLNYEQAEEFCVKAQNGERNVPCCQRGRGSPVMASMPVTPPSPCWQGSSVRWI